MPQKLDAILTQGVDRARARKAEFPAKSLLRSLQKFLDDNVEPSDAELLKSTLAPLYDLLNLYSEGQKVRDVPAHRSDPAVLAASKWFGGEWDSDRSLHAASGEKRIPTEHFDLAILRARGLAREHDHHRHQEELGHRFTSDRGLVKLCGANPDT